MVLTLVERGGSARSFHVDGARIGDLQPIIRANLSREANLMSDEMYSYKEIGREFASHETVTHSKEEYVREIHSVVKKPASLQSRARYFIVIPTLGVIADRQLAVIHLLLGWFAVRMNITHRVQRGPVSSTGLSLRPVPG